MVHTSHYHINRDTLWRHTVYMAAKDGTPRAAISGRHKDHAVFAVDLLFRSVADIETFVAELQAMANNMAMLDAPPVKPPDTSETCPACGVADVAPPWTYCTKCLDKIPF